MSRLGAQTVSVLIALAVTLVTGAFYVPRGPDPLAPLDLLAQLGPARLLAAAPPVQASPDGHRLGEFMATTSPADPEHLLLTAVDWDHDTGGPWACAVYVSRDGGRSWVESAPIPGLDAPHVRVDPWVSIDAQGRAHLNCMDFDTDMLRLAQGKVPTIISFEHARSDDGGYNFRPSTRIPPFEDPEEVDKNAIHAARSGTLFNCIGAGWFDTGSALTIARSRDGGDTWLPTQRLEQADLCNGIAEGARGEIYISTYGPAGMGVVASYDDGETWTDFVDIGMQQYRPEGDRPDTLGIGPREEVPGVGRSSLAADPLEGDVWFAAVTWNEDLQRYDPQLFRSIDRGATWPEFQLPAFARCTGCWIGYPVLAHDAAGRLAMQYVAVTPDGDHKEVYMTVTVDDGQTWSAPYLVAGWTFDQEAYTYAKDIPRNQAGVMNGTRYLAAHPWEAPSQASTPLRGLQRDDHVRWGGDYWGITTTSDGFLAVWLQHDASGAHELWTQRLVLVT